MKNKALFHGIGFVACITGLAVLLMLVYCGIDGKDSGMPEYSDVPDGRICLGTEIYIPQEHIETCLVIGTDEDSRQADFLALITADCEEESLQILYIDRNTMTDIPAADDSEGFGRIAFSYSYGSSRDSRCRNTVRTVEKLLGGIKIDHYISLDINSIGIINDRLGGVSLTSEDAVVTLTGKQAVEYVKYPDEENTDPSELLKRRKQYAKALQDMILEEKQENPDVVLQILRSVVNQMESDFSAAEMEKFFENLERVSDAHHCKFVLSIGSSEDEVPEYIRKYAH